MEGSGGSRRRGVARLASFNSGRRSGEDQHDRVAQPHLASGLESSLWLCASVVNHGNTEAESTGTYNMKKSETETSSRLRQLTDELQQLEARLRLAGGPEKIDRQHQQGKLTARERLEKLLDKGAYVQEIGLLVAYDQ